MAEQDTEITLGTGRLLGLFFGLVALCGVFFGVGYSLGRNATHMVEPVAVAGLPPSTTSVPKPSAAHAADAKANCADPKGCGDSQPNTTDELTFYKSVGQKDANAQLQQPAATPASASATTASAPAGTPPPELPAAGGLSGGYMVQVAAVTKQEDADALVNALRQKQYPVFVATVPTDKLFHIQVGPFSDIKDADGMRQRLMSDGYNPIVKK